MKTPKKFGYSLIEVLILLIVISGIMYYTVIPSLTKKNPETANNLEDYVSTSVDTRVINPDNPYGLSFKIVAKRDDLTWKEAQEFCNEQNSKLINAQQAEEIMKAIYPVPNSNCKKEDRNGFLSYRLCIPYIIESQQLKQYLNDGNPYQILIWISEMYDNVNGMYLYLTENSANIHGMAVSNRAKALCVE